MNDGSHIFFPIEGIEATANEGDSLLDVIRAAGLPIEALCSGRGTCGKCRVRVNGIEGLACRTTAEDGMRVEILASSEEQVILTDSVTDGDMQPDAQGRLAKSPAAHAIDIAAMKSPAASNVDIDAAKSPAAHAVGIDAVKSPAAYAVNADVMKSPAASNVDIDAAKSPAAFAVDIGTTTVVVKALETVSGGEIGVRAFANPQRVYGADVLSRINESMDDAALLSGIITGAVGRAIEDIVKNEAAGRETEKVVIAGNTTMTYLLLNLRCRSLGLAPFEPEYATRQIYDYSEVFGTETLSCPVLIYPYISAFVGGDIVSGLVNIETHLEGGKASPEPSYMLIDMGTNGEIAYRNGARLLTTSTAAGPALEGGNITCGMSGLPGAIDEVAYAGEGKFTFHTIGDKPALGFCGSGVISVVAALLDAGLVSDTGAFTEEAELIAAKQASERPWIASSPSAPRNDGNAAQKQFVIAEADGSAPRNDGNTAQKQLVIAEADGSAPRNDRNTAQKQFAIAEADSAAPRNDGNTMPKQLVIAEADGAEPIVFTQKDVREFQLAKGAIRAGIDILIEEMGEAPESLYLAGGFGQSIDLESAFRVGLIPQGLRGRIRFVGNTSLGGCVDACMAGGAEGPLPSLDIISAAQEINLGAHKSFNNKFMETMLFE